MKKDLFDKHMVIFLSIAIIAFAVLFRTWRLKEVPPGIWRDESVNAIEGMNAIENREIKAFFPSIGGREGLAVYLIGFSVKTFGENQPWAARLPSVLSGLYPVSLDCVYTPRIVISPFPRIF